MWTTEDEEALLQCCSCKSLLRDPLLLRCLHNICSKCFEKVRCVKEGSTFLVCPACSHHTGMGMEKENLFIASQVSELEKVRNASTCGICLQGGKANEIADDWCSKCQMSMCGPCSSAHYLHNRDHWPTSLAEVGSIRDLLERSVHTCRRHGKTYDEMCWTCKIPTCTSCSEECHQNSHDVQIFSTQKTLDHYDRTKKELCLIHEGLTTKRKILQDCRNVISELDVARLKDIKELQANKRAAADSLDRAYKAAEAALNVHYSKLLDKALELKRSVELMDPRLGHASEYSRYLADSEDRIGFLHQVPVLLSGLHALVKELDEIRAPQDATKLVAIVGAMPENLDDHTSAWIGMPRLLTDDLCCNDELIAKLEMDVNKSSHLDDLCCSDEVIAKLEMDVKKSLQLGAGSSPQLDNNKFNYFTTRGALDLTTRQVLDREKSAARTFKSPIKCCDVAVFADGCSLLLAAREAGMKEFDLSGVELSSWKPAEKGADGEVEAVTALDVLRNGSVAAGLLYSQCVVLLSCGPAAGDKWHEDMRVTDLRISPRLLSVHVDLVIVSEYRLVEELQQWEADRELVLASLSCGRVLNRQRREYEIWSVAVTAQILVTSSWEQVKLRDGREARVVDACNHAGQLLWRQELDAWDICAVPSVRCLYMALCRSDRVTTVRAEDGVELKDILSSHSVKRPARLSVYVKGLRTVTCALSADWTTVTVNIKDSTAATKDDLFCGTDHGLLLEVTPNSTAPKNDLCCIDEVKAELEMDVKKSLQLGDCIKSQHDENQSSDIAHELPDLGPASSAFQTPVYCYDVAVSSDGCRLLLAAEEHGLLEYNMSGEELSRWRPAEEETAKGRNEWVMAVEALEDGRVAVCLPYSECVVLLRRRGSWQKGAAWLEEKRVTGLQIEPWRLSVRGDLVAVAGSGAGNVGLPDHRLLLLSLSCGRVLSRQQREYNIWSVVLTAQAVLTASGWRGVKLSDWRVGCVVEAYSHDGQLLWRQERGEGDRVWDMCSALCGRVVYMAVWRRSGSRVTAVRAEDGRVIRDVLTSSSHGLKNPWRLSMGSRGQQTVTAVMGHGRVTVYRATGAQQQQLSARLPAHSYTLQWQVKE